jgi:hypothetical protein
MQRLYPAVMDRQARDNPIYAPDERTQPLRPNWLLMAMTEHRDVLDLEHSVRDGLEVRYPTAVFVTGPPNTFLTIRITKHRHGQSDDVTQRPFHLVEDAALLPADWLAEGDLVVAERR